MRWDHNRCIIPSDGSNFRPWICILLHFSLFLFPEREETSFVLWFCEVLCKKAFIHNPFHCQVMLGLLRKGYEQFMGT
jgi:hypothetical protein